MLKITQAQSNGHAAMLRLEGRLVGPWVAELRRACERPSSAAEPLRLDLAGVIWADRDGIELLRELVRRGAALLHGAEFIERQLAEPEGER